MKKLVLVINGAGGVGKDTLCDFAAKHFKVKNVSSITPIKEIAALCGWDGSKDDKARKFLSDLKRLCIDYNDYPTVWAKARLDEFLVSDEEIMFLHVREGVEIAKFVEASGGVAKTLLVRPGKRLNKECYGNVSDDEVENYTYDFYYTNDKTFEEAESEFVTLLGRIIDKA